MKPIEKQDSIVLISNHPSALLADVGFQPISIGQEMPLYFLVAKEALLLKTTDLQKT